MERDPEYARRKDQPEEEGPEPDGGKPVPRPPRAPVGGPAVDTGALALEQATQAAAAEPAPSLADGLLPEPAPAPAATGSADSKREKRRQRVAPSHMADRASPLAFLADVGLPPGRARLRPPPRAAAHPPADGPCDLTLSRRHTGTQRRARKPRGI